MKNLIAILRKILLINMMILVQSVSGQTSGTGLTLELPGFWGHLRYLITGAEFDTPTGSDRGKVGGRQYKGQLQGNELTISGYAVSDNESRGPGSLDYYELNVSVTVGKETKQYNYIAPLGEKLNKTYFLSVPIAPDATTGSFAISLLENTAYNGQYGWVVSGFLSRTPVVKSGEQPPEPEAADENENRKDCGARFTIINGDVEVLHAGGNEKTDWKLAKRESVLYVGDRIKTAEDSHCALGFSDMSTFILKPESEIELADPPNKDSKFRLVAGNIWVNVKKMVQNGSMEIDMDQAVAGIKGTTFIMSAAKTSSTLKVIEGAVSFRSKSNGKIVTVNSGESVTASNSGLSAKSVFDKASESKEWDVIKKQESIFISGKESIVFQLKSGAGVHGNPSNKTIFELTKPTRLTRIFTYHWNRGKGATPGTISLKDLKTGQMLGTWQVIGNNMNPNTPGEPFPLNSGSSPYYYWTALPNISVPAGKYEVIDSDQATWSTNMDMGNMGCTWVYGKQ